MKKSLDRKAADDLFMHYRIERAARRVGRVSLFIFIFGLSFVASVVALFRPKYV